MNNLLVTTTHQLENRSVNKYLGATTVQYVVGMNAFKDMASGFTDFFGGASGSYNKTLSETYKIVIDKLSKKANRMGGNAVVGFSLDIDEISAQGKSMLMFSALGTVVLLDDAPQGVSFESQSFTSEDMKIELKKKEVLRKVYSNSFFEESMFNFMAEHKMYDGVEAFLIRFEKSGKPDEGVFSLLKKLINTLDQSMISKLLYQSLDEKTQSWIIPLIKSQKLLDYDEVLKYVVKEDEIGIKLLATERQVFFVEDIKKIDDLLSAISSHFPDRSLNKEKKKMLGGTKEVWECYSCKEDNEKDIDSCANCGADKRGIKSIKISMDKIIEKLELHKSILEQNFS